MSDYWRMGNNPVLYVDRNGEWIHLAIGAFIGGVMNWAMNGAQFNAKGLGYFGVGALAGAMGAGVGAGVSSALAGGSSGAGFIGLSSAMAVGTGFMSGSIVGASAGAAGGFTMGFGNGLVGGSGIAEAFKQGAISGGIGALSGGLLGGYRGELMHLETEEIFGQEKERDLNIIFPQVNLLVLVDIYLDNKWKRIIITL